VGSAKKRELFRLAFDLWVEPQDWPQLVETRLFARHEAAEVVGFQDMPVLLVKG
jgi:hypothetical protein